MIFSPYTLTDKTLLILVYFFFFNFSWINLPYVV